MAPTAPLNPLPVRQSLRGNDTSDYIHIIAILLTNCLLNSMTPSTMQPSVTPTTYPSLSPNALFVITTIAGSGASSYSGDNGAATSAGLNSPFGVALDSSGTSLKYINLVAI